MKKISIAIMMGVVGIFVSTVGAQEEVPPLVYEGFDYSEPFLGGLNGGTGWEFAWADPEGDLSLSEDDTSLTSAAFSFATGARVQDGGGELISRANRNMLKKIHMAADGETLYMSILMRKGIIDAASGEWIEVALANGANKRFFIGIGSDDKFFLQVSNTGVKVLTDEVAVAGETYFLVAKLVSGSSMQYGYLKIYASGDTVDASEPTVWDLTANGYTGYNLNLVDINFGANTSQGAVDEFRAGDTWESVTPTVPQGSVVVVE